jgi:phosphoenolpyruvate-protein kinase (PTS system EI component)
MVSQLDEFKRAKAMVLEEVDRRTSELDVAIGIMVEVPSAALNASWLAKEADFFSIGTNDLTQYTLAMDRGHPELSKQADAFDPAVLRLIAMTVEAAHAEGKWVGVCGGLAAEPLAAPLLVGLRLDELSVPAPAIPELKARICSLRQRDCLALAEGALAMPSASRVRALLQDFLTLDPRP